MKSVALLLLAISGAWAIALTVTYGIYRLFEPLFYNLF